MNINKKIVTAYAKSLFQNIRSNEGSQESKKKFALSQITSPEQKAFSPDVFIIGEELILLRSILISSKKLQGFFKNPTYLEEQKLEVLLNIFPGLTTTTKSFLKILTERSHLSLIPEVSDEYSSILARFKNSSKVRLTTASPISASFGPKLLETLKSLTNSDEIILNFAYNPKLLGGLVLEYNSLSIDASILKEFSLFFNEI